MFNNIRESWRRFKGGQPGHRFQDRYYRRHQAAQGRLNPGKLFNIVGGMGLALVGFFLVPAPGPGWGIVFFGLGMLASEFLTMARLLDWGEVRSRGLARQVRNIWTRSPVGVKVLIGLITLICVVAVAYGAYQLVYSMA